MWSGVLLGQRSALLSAAEEAVGPCTVSLVVTEMLVMDIGVPEGGGP